MERNRIPCMVIGRYEKLTDEGIILDVANDDPGVNDSGVQIESSDWSVGSAWAPTIEEKDGKYYFYYCAKFPNGESAIGRCSRGRPRGSVYR